MQLSGSRIWLVGASEGIGRALALQLVTVGARVVSSARNQERLTQLDSEIARDTHCVKTVDVTQRETLQTAYNDIIREWGGIDCVIFNAGTYTPMAIDSWNLDNAIATLDVNYNGAMRLVDVVLPEMLRASAGRIVMVSSVAAYRGLPESAAYGASKAALTNFTEYLKIETANKGITVQCVSPGFVQTRLTAQNSFAMPAMITPEVAAARIVHGLQRDVYDIHFPHRFTWIMKLLRVLPIQLYFGLIKKGKFA